MCGLCSSDSEEREKTKRHMFTEAERMERLARNYRDLANGTISPHTSKTGHVAATARAVIRSLVEEWV